MKITFGKSYIKYKYEETLYKPQLRKPYVKCQEIND